MSKKFTMLLMSLLAFVGVAKAGVTDLPQMSEGDNITWYTIKNTRSGKYANYAGDAVQMTQVATPSLSSFFYFTASDAATEEGFTPVMIHNALTTNKLAGFDSWTEAGNAWFLSTDVQNDPAAGLHITNTAAVGSWNGQAGWNAFNDKNGSSITNYAAQDGGSVFVIEAVEAATISALVDAYKTTAINALKTLGTAVDFAAAETAINEVALDGGNYGKYLADIDAVVNAAVQYVAFRNGDATETSSRYNNYLGADMVNGKGNGHTTFNHLSDVWSLKYTGQGSFYVYNVNNKVYLGNPGSNGALAATPNAEYTFELIEGNKVEFKSGGQTLHLNNHNTNNVVSTGRFLSSYDNDDAASRWYVETDFASQVAAHKASTITVLDESLPDVCALIGVDANLVTEAKAAVEAIATTDYATFATIDAKVKTVTDAIAAKDVVFQNSNTTEANRSNVYLATDMSDNKGRGNKEFDYNAVWSLRHAGGAAFYLYNDLHKVYLGNPAGEGALTSAPVSSYTFEVVEASTKMVELKSGGQTLHVHNWADCTLTNWDSDESASRWYVSTIDITADIQALIAANVDNHAETPALGQYTTVGYEALVAAKSTVKTVEEVDAAIAAFKATLNRPVYFITSAWDNDYSAGSAIYYDGAAWKWKTANIFDKQMWMAIPGYTEENVPTVSAYDENGTSYEICDYLTSTVMRGKKVQIVAVEGWDGAYSLQYNADATSTDAAHHAQGGGALVNWKPATANDCQASAWRVEYIGNSYDLDQLTDEYFAAGAELAAVNVPNFTFAAGVNNYDETTKPALDAAIANRTEVLNKLSTAEDIAAAKAQLEAAIAGVQLNMPVPGHYYRIRCADTGNGMKRLQSTTGQKAENDIRLEMKSGNEGINDGSIFHYVDGGLKSYTEKKFINAYRFEDSENVPQVTFSTAGHGAVGCYYINIGGRYIFGAGDQIDSGSGTPDNRAGYTWWLELADDVVVNNYKASANFTLDAWENLSALFDAEAVATAKESVNALTDVTELAAIDEVLQGIRNSADGKSVKFENCAVDDRGGRFLGYDRGNARIAGVLSNNDDVLWTIKFVDNNTFKLYNFINNIWLGGPDYAYDTNTVTKTETKTETNENGEEVEVEVEVEVEEKSNYRTPAIENEADAVVYKFIIRDNNKVTLSTTTDKIAHLGNSGNKYRIMEYGSDSEASNWSLVNVGVIPFDREGYNTFVSQKSDLMNSLIGYAKQMQDDYGLVKSGDDVKVVVNHPSGGDSQPSSNLLDGDNGSYVHSAYQNDDLNVTNHYIEVELSAATQNIFCYFSKRNNNNRPTFIKVYGGKNADEFTENPVATLYMLESLDNNVQSYFSKAIDLGDEYTHLRFAVANTNTGSRFFTLSEFYVLPVNDVTEGITDLVGASIIDTDLEARWTAANNSLKTLSLSETLAEVKATLDANASNHAETPQLGQYTTVAYNNLKEAYEACVSIDGLDAVWEAFDGFKVSLNKPVYIIKSAWDAGYSAGAAIYYDGDWKWKKANMYDKQMWMTIPGYTQEEAPFVDAYDENGTSYEICDYLTGTVMRGKSVQIVKVPSWEGAYSLQYNANANSIDAAQHAKDNGVLTYWKPAMLTDCQASAWRVEYLGNTYDLAKLTEDKLEAMIGLQNTFDRKNYLFNGVFGEGIGQYQGEETAVKNTLFQAATVLGKSLMELKNEPIETIVAHTTALAALDATINLPLDGKYYRIYGASSNVSPAGQYITGHTNSDGGRIALTNDADASTIYYFKDGKLQAYQSGKYIGLTSTHWTFADETHPASAIEFAASSYVAGAYTIKSDDRYLHYKVYNGEVEIDRLDTENSDNDAWFLQEVQKEVITYIYKIGETVLATQEVKEFAGMPYPNATEILPLGYAVANAVVEGNVSVGENVKDIACEFDATAIPFEYYDSYANVEQWYYLNFAKDQNYLYYDADNTVLDATQTKVDRKNRSAYAWAFIGTPATGFQVVNKLAGADKGLKALKSETLTGGVVGEGAHTFKLTASGDFTNGFYMAATNGESAERFNKQGGKMVYWGGADAGSTFTVAVCPFGPVAELKALIAEAEELKTIVDGNTGDKIGEYTQATANSLANALDVAKSKGDAATAADVTALGDAIDATKIVLPTVGTYYQLYSTVNFAETKAVYSHDGKALWKTLDNDDKSFYWKAVATEDGGVALMNANDEKYLQGNTNQSGAWTVSDEKASVDIKIFSKAENANGYQYGIVLNNWQMHANGHSNGSGNASNIVSWNTNTAGSASSWYIVPVVLPTFYDIVYEFTYNGVAVEKFTQKAALIAGKDYPEVQLPSQLPYGISIVATTPEGHVTESKTFEFAFKVDEEFSLPFEAAATGEPTKWYYTQMHAYAGYGFYVSANDDNLVWHGTIEDAAKYIAEDANHDDYLWGFVGNIWDGFKMVNKAGKAVISTGDGAVTVGELANATAFKAWKSKAGGEWFCMKHPTTGDYLNLNSGKSIIDHWNENDNGSSILVTEPGKEESLEVASIGYSTYYSDRRLSIPESVKAYVVTSVENREVVLEQVTGIIPAHTGLILRGAGKHTFVASTDASTSDVSGNLLKGTTTKTLITPAEGYTCYVLANPKDGNGVGLYRASLNQNDGKSFYNNANKVYLPVENADVEEGDGQSARALRFRFGGTTDIETMETTDNGQQSRVIYDLTGRRITEIVEKGIYIVNGKKVVIK